MFAGACLSQEGVKPNLDKVAAVIDFPHPEMIHDAVAVATGLPNLGAHVM